MSKRLFEVLDEMNLHDIENGTQLVKVSGAFIKSDLKSRGTEILMGAESQASHDLMNNKVIPVLILVDREEYNKRINTFKDGE